MKDLEEQFASDWKRDTSEAITSISKQNVPGKTLHTLTSYNGHESAPKVYRINETGKSQHSS